MAGPSPGVAALDRVEAILRNPEIYQLASLIPQPSREKGGRGRDYPDFMYLAYEALISVYTSARQVEAELSHKVVWKLMRRTVKKMFPEDESMRLPSRPMRRHHYLYGRNRYTLCVNPLPKKTSIMGVVHSRGGREFPQFRNPAEALLGSLTRDPERFSQLAPGVPETSGSCHHAGELLRGDPESVYRRLDGLQGAPVASVDEAAADDALAHGGAPGVAAATQGHRSVDNHGATLAVRPQDGVACEATNDGRVNMP